MCAMLKANTHRTKRGRDEKHSLIGFMKHKENFILDYYYKVLYIYNIYKRYIIYIDEGLLTNTIFNYFLVCLLAV